jgi:hypothetical protein
VIVATKFGIMCSSKPSAGGGSPITGINGRPEYVRAACDAPLKRLGSSASTFIINTGSMPRRRSRRRSARWPSWSRPNGAGPADSLEVSTRPVAQKDAQRVGSHAAKMFHTSKMFHAFFRPTPATPLNQI